MYLGNVSQKITHQLDRSVKQKSYSLSISVVSVKILTPCPGVNHIDFFPFLDTRFLENYINHIEYFKPFKGDSCVLETVQLALWRCPV